MLHSKMRINPCIKINLISPVHPASLFERAQRQATSPWREKQSSSSLTSRDDTSSASPCIIHVLLMLRQSARPLTHVNAPACMRTGSSASPWILTPWGTDRYAFTDPFLSLWRDLRWNNSGKRNSLIEQGKSQTISSVFWFTGPHFALGSCFFFFFKEGRVVVFRRGSWCMLNTVR